MTEDRGATPGGRAGRVFDLAALYLESMDTPPCADCGGQHVVVRGQVGWLVDFGRSVCSCSCCPEATVWALELLGDVDAEIARLERELDEARRLEGDQ